jgi:hypothetical protein
MLDAGLLGHARKAARLSSGTQPVDPTRARPEPESRSNAGYRVWVNQDVGGRVADTHPSSTDTSSDIADHLEPPHLHVTPGTKGGHRCRIEKTQGPFPTPDAVRNAARRWIEARKVDLEEKLIPPAGSDLF